MYDRPRDHMAKVGCEVDRKDRFCLINTSQGIQKEILTSRS